MKASRKQAEVDSVKRWYAGSRANQGWGLIGPSVSSNQARVFAFYSSNDSDPAKRPVLEVIFDDP